MVPAKTGKYSPGKNGFIILQKDFGSEKRKTEQSVKISAYSPKKLATGNERRITEDNLKPISEKIRIQNENGGCRTSKAGPC